MSNVKLSKVSLYGLLFLIAYVFQNSCFGWNRNPDSALEFWTDLLWQVPLYLLTVQIIAEAIAASVEKISEEDMEAVAKEYFEEHPIKK